MLAQLRALWLQVAVRCAKLEGGTAWVKRVIREAGDRVPILDPLADKAKASRYLLKVFLEPDAGVATQRGCLRFTARVADLAGDFLRLDEWHRGRAAAQRCCRALRRVRPFF